MTNVDRILAYFEATSDWTCVADIADDFGITEAHAHVLLSMLRKRLQGTDLVLQGTWVYDSDGTRTVKQYLLGNRWVESADVVGDYGLASLEAIIPDMLTRMVNGQQHVVAAKASSDVSGTLATHLDDLARIWHKTIVQVGSLAKKLEAAAAAAAK